MQQKQNTEILGFWKLKLDIYNTDSADTTKWTRKKAQKIGDKLKCILIGKWFHWWIEFLVPKVGKILNPTHYGKVRK